MQKHIRRTQLGRRFDNAAAGGDDDDDAIVLGAAAVDSTANAYGQVKQFLEDIYSYVSNYPPGEPTARQLQVELLRRCRSTVDVFEFVYGTANAVGHQRLEDAPPTLAAAAVRIVDQTYLHMQGTTTTHAVVHMDSVDSNNSSADTQSISEYVDVQPSRPTSCVSSSQLALQTCVAAAAVSMTACASVCDEMLRRQSAFSQPRSSASSLYAQCYASLQDQYQSDSPDSSATIELCPKTPPAPHVVVNTTSHAESGCPFLGLPAAHLPLQRALHTGWLPETRRLLPVSLKRRYAGVMSGGWLLLYCGRNDMKPHSYVPLHNCTWSMLGNSGISTDGGAISDDHRNHHYKLRLAWTHPVVNGGGNRRLRSKVFELGSAEERHEWVDAFERACARGLPMFGAHRKLPTPPPSPPRMQSRYLEEEDICAELHEALRPLEELQEEDEKIGELDKMKNVNDNCAEEMGEGLGVDWLADDTAEVEVQELHLILEEEDESLSESSIAANESEKMQNSDVEHVDAAQSQRFGSGTSSHLYYNQSTETKQDSRPRFTIECVYEEPAACMEAARHGQDGRIIQMCNGVPGTGCGKRTIIIRDHEYDIPQSRAVRVMNNASDKENAKPMEPQAQETIDEIVSIVSATNAEPNTPTSTVDTTSTATTDAPVIASTKFLDLQQKVASQLVPYSPSTTPRRVVKTQTERPIEDDDTPSTASSVTTKSCVGTNGSNGNQPTRKLSWLFNRLSMRRGGQNKKKATLEAGERTGAIAPMSVATQGDSTRKSDLSRPEHYQQPVLMTMTDGNDTNAYENDDAGSKVSRIKRQLEACGHPVRMMADGRTAATMGIGQQAVIEVAVCGEGGGDTSAQPLRRERRLQSVAWNARKQPQFHEAIIVGTEVAAATDNDNSYEPVGFGKKMVTP